MARLRCGAGSVRAMRGAVWDRSYERIWEHVAKDPHTSKKEGCLTGTREGRRVERGKKKSHQERVQEAEGEVSSWRFHDTKKAVEHRQTDNAGR